MGDLSNQIYTEWDDFVSPPKNGPAEQDFFKYTANLPRTTIDYPAIYALWHKHYEAGDASLSVMHRYANYINDLAEKLGVIDKPEAKPSGKVAQIAWSLKTEALKSTLRSKTRWRVYSYVPATGTIIGRNKHGPNPFFMITTELKDRNREWRIFLAIRESNTWVVKDKIPGHKIIVSRGEPTDLAGAESSSDPDPDILDDIDDADEAIPADVEANIMAILDDKSTDPPINDPNNTNGNSTNPSVNPGSGNTPFPSVLPSSSTKNVPPPNLSSGFGGVDASAPIFSINSFYPNLFDLNIGPGVSTFSLSCNGPDGSPATIYTVPDYLNFTWGTENARFSAVGSTKREFARNLSNHVKIDANLMGFGAEFSRTFDDTTTEETFHKYMARYDQQYMYKVGFKDRDAAPDCLTADAQYALDNWDASKIVDTFGTHYTIEVNFGGLRIYSFISEQVDTFKKTELEWGLEAKAPLKAPGKPDKDSGDDKKDSVTVDGGANDTKRDKLVKSMETMETRTLGGTAPNSDTDLQSWNRSLYFNPVAVNYKLKPIYELLPENHENYQPLKDEVAKRLTVSAPQDPFGLLAIRVPLKPYTSDEDSRGMHDLSVAWPDVPDGWLRIGQFAQAAEWGRNTMGHNQAVAVRVNPNFSWEDKPPSVVPAVSCTAKWTHNRHGRDFGFFTPIGPKPADDKGPKYEALGDFFENTRSPEGVPSVNLQSLAMFHESMLNTAYTTDRNPTWIWDDTDTGADQDVAVWGAPPNLEELHPPNEKRVLVTNPGGALAYLFQCVPRHTNHKTIPWRTLRWDKVKWLDRKLL